MSLNDPVADMLNRIRNAGNAHLKTVDAPYSKLKDELCRVLKREGLIREYAVEGDGVRKALRIQLKYDRAEGAGRIHVIRGLRRISTPGCRRYAAADKLPRVRSGTGMAILTTSRGLMTDREARKQSIGGEVLCHVW
jgi:small subunit ribosomal protein S8